MLWKKNPKSSPTQPPSIDGRKALMNLVKRCFLAVLLITFTTIVFCEDVPAWQVFIDSRPVAELVPKDDKDDALHTLRVEYCNEDGSTSMGSGSAVAIGNDELLTASHCVLVSAYNEVYIRLREGWIQCDVIALDTDLDVALLRSRIPLKGNCLTIDDNEYESGTAVVYGAPYGRRIRTTVDLKAKATKGLYRSNRLTSMQIGPGWSGGPVVRDHKLIGLMSAIKIVAKNHTGDAFYVNSKEISAWVKDIHEKEKKKEQAKGAIK